MTTSMSSPASVNAGFDDYSPTRRKTVDLETIRLHFSSFFARLQSRVSLDTLRPLPMFLGVNPTNGLCFSSAAFTTPVRKIDKSTPEKIKSRVQLNLHFFLTNYVLVASMVGIVVALMHPGMVSHNGQN